MVDRFQRTFGMYSMSIATSLAFEGLTHTGEYLDRRGVAPINDTEFIMINMRTLVRNVITAFPTSEQMSLRGKTVYECCCEDYAAIVELVRGYQPACRVELYVSSYKSINKDFKEVNFKKRDTPKQLALESLEKEVMRRFEENEEIKVVEYDYKLKGERPCLIFTHHPIDLLSYYNFPALSLLESHTGIIKERKDWGSKLNTPKGCTTIPFNKPMLCIFGDKVFINGQASKVKRAVINVSEKCLWNGLTTVSKQASDCKRSNEPHLSIFISQYKA